MVRIFFILAVLSVRGVFGNSLIDLGTYGQTYPVIENDLLEVLEKRAKNIDQDILKQKLLDKVKHKILYPSSLALGLAKENRHFFYDPSFFVEKDIKDHLGNIFWKAGQRINPLDQVSLVAPMLFFDGDDPKQLEWAMTQHGESRFILTAGRPLHLEEKLKRPVYYDQRSILTKKLGIQHIPARVTQEGKLLKIEEIKIDFLKRVEQKKS